MFIDSINEYSFHNESPKRFKCIFQIKEVNLQGHYKIVLTYLCNLKLVTL